MRLGSVAALRFHTFPSLLPHFLLTVSTPIYAQGTGWAGADLSLYVGSDTLVASNLTLPPGYSFASLNITVPPLASIKQRDTPAVPPILGTSLTFTLIAKVCRGQVDGFRLIRV